LNSEMSDEFGWKPKYQEDGVHLNAEGYRVLSEMVKN
jgi:lysophospholipase L1-like esterase